MISVKQKDDYYQLLLLLLCKTLRMNIISSDNIDQIFIELKAVI